MSKIPGTVLDYDDEIPSYEDSIVSRPSPHSLDRKTSSGSSLQQRLAQTRAQRISEVITKYIEPHLSSHGIDGVAKRALILIPSDVLSHQKISRQNLVSSGTSEIDLVRLQGDAHRASFWQQPAVVTALDQELKNYFGSSETVATTPTAAPPSLPPRPEPSPRKSWLRRTFTQPGPDPDPTGSTGQWNLGWRSEDQEHTRQTPLSADEIHASGRLRDVSLRFETELGLLATETVKCVWVEIEVGV